MVVKEQLLVLQDHLWLMLAVAEVVDLMIFLHAHLLMMEELEV
jgi:hypothetical protein